MPAPAMTPSERDERAARLSKELLATGLSLRHIARHLADLRDGNADTIYTNLRRWVGPARPGAIDAAPDWAMDEIAKIRKSSPQKMASELREAWKQNYVAPSLALRAACVIEGLSSTRDGRKK